MYEFYVSAQEWIYFWFCFAYYLFYFILKNRISILKTSIFSPTAVSFKLGVGLKARRTDNELECPRIDPDGGEAFFDFTIPCVSEIK